MFGQIQLIIGAALLIFGLIGGWTANGWRYKADRTIAMEAQQKALEATAKELAKLDVKYVTIRQEVVREVLEKPVYRDCVHTPDGLQLVNAALRPGSVSSGKLPRANANERE
jgi:hypothetical protein